MISIVEHGELYNANSKNIKILLSNTHDIAIVCPFKSDNQAHDHVSLSLIVKLTCFRKRDRRMLELLCKKYIAEIKDIFNQDFYSRSGYGYTIVDMLKSKSDKLDFKSIGLVVYYNA